MRCIQAGNLEHTAQLAGSSTGWRMFHPSDTVGLNHFCTTELVSAFFQDVGLILESYWQLGLPESAFQWSLLTLVERGLVKLVSLRAFLEVL